ncbi:hypothetical protein BSL78_01280 [Apostichopus japonicus]|uniref:Uncharacterized protein n=1 Tax=Stichopus japonicus TaxID=307972 RepID=A0A2G8LNL1_STIJA|nr:hypothetical protein BSL78_01280 [Apostichopus japonicus]
MKSYPSIATDVTLGFLTGPRRRGGGRHTEDEVTIENGPPESLTVWASRSLSTPRNDQDAITSTDESDTGPPSYNDVILNEEPPPPSYDDVITSGTYKEQSGDG